MAIINVYDNVWVREGAIDNPLCFDVHEDVLAEDVVTVSCSTPVIPPAEVERVHVYLFHKGYAMFPWESMA